MRYLILFLSLFAFVSISEAGAGTQRGVPPIPARITPPSGGAGVTLAIDTTTSNSGGFGTTSFTWSHTVTGSELLLLVGSGQTPNAGSIVSSITYDSVSLLFGRRHTRDSSQIIEGWFLENPHTGEHNVVVTYDGSLFGAGTSATSFVGVNQSSATGHWYMNNNGSSATPSVTVPSEAGGIVIDFVMTNGANINGVGAGQESLAQRNASTPKYMSSSENGAASVDMTWDLSGSTEWQNLGLPVKD